MASKQQISTSSNWGVKMFRIIFPNTWYVDHHGTPCKILRST
ncbi:DUF4222 domain-containing protein, partial [Escherichia coli]